MDVPPTAVLIWQYSYADVPCAPLFRGKGFVAVEWGSMIVVSYYFSPNLSDVDFERGLHDLGARILSCSQRPLLILGDFNARYSAWDLGDANRRGRILSGWARGLDLVLLNSGFVPTCVHPRGASCVDLVLDGSQS